MTRYPGRAMGIGERSTVPTVLPLPPTLGTPITETTAIALRQTVFGECPNMVRSEFFSRGPGFVFREAEKRLSYGITFVNPDLSPFARSVMMVVQANIVRILLFETDPSRAIKSRRDPLEPTRNIQKEALSWAIADILWRAGGGKSCTLCLPSKTSVYVPETPDFNQDGVTERLQLITFDRLDDVIPVLKRYLYIFHEDPGPAVLLLIYSAVLSRGFDRIADDMFGRAVNYKGFSSKPQMISYKGNVSYSVVCLLLTGRASQYLHNGVQYRGDENTAAIAETGVMIRSPLGILAWMGSDEKTNALNVGSRLKTPIFPIWVVLASEQIGLLFCLDRALMRDYRNEYNFQLHYYTSSHYQQSDTILSICTRGFEETEPAEITVHTLDRVIRTKWAGARVSWNGVIPYL